MSYISITKHGLERLFQDRNLDKELAMYIHQSMVASFEETAHQGSIDLSKRGVDISFDLHSTDDQQFLIQFDAWVFCVTGGLMGFPDTLRMNYLGVKRPRKVIRAGASTR